MHKVVVLICALACLATLSSLALCASAASHTRNIASITRASHGGNFLCRQNDFALPATRHAHNLRLRGGLEKPSSNLDCNSSNLNQIQSQNENSAIATKEEDLVEAELRSTDRGDRTKAELEQELARERIGSQAKISQLEQDLACALAREKKISIILEQQAGRFFLTFESLTSCETKILRPSDNSDPAQAEYFQSIRNANTLLKLYLAPNQSGLEENSHTNRISGLSGCMFDIINQRREHEISCEGAHVMPFTETCNSHWKKINKFRLNMEYVETKADNTRYGMWLYGYVCVTPSESVKKPQKSWKSRLVDAVTEIIRPLSGGIKKPEKKVRKQPIVIHSGYLHSAANFIALRNQHQWFDKFPSILWLPLNRTALQLWSFFSDSLEFIIICSDDKCYREIGANVEFSEISWISCNHPDVQSAFQVFGEVMAVVIGVVCDDDHSKATKVDNVKEFREYFQNNSVKMFQAPCVKPGCEGYFLKVKLDRPRVGRPGTELEPWNRFHAHPSPDPINLICRSFNAFSTYLLNKDALRGIKKSAGKECCKLFPSCLDTKGAKECIICSANALLHNPSQVPFFSSEYHEKLLDIVNLRSSEL
jgi:hypothetical protein